MIDLGMINAKLNYMLIKSDTNIISGKELEDIFYTFKYSEKIKFLTITYSISKSLIDLIDKSDFKFYNYNENENQTYVDIDLMKTSPYQKYMDLILFEFLNNNIYNQSLRTYDSSVYKYISYIGDNILRKELYSAYERKSHLVKGSYFPNIILKDIHNNNKTIYDYPKTKKIVRIWGTWCSPCIEGIPDFNKACKKYGDKIEFISIAPWRKRN